MDLKLLTKKVDIFIQENGGYWDPPWLLAAIIEELGELSRTLQEHFKIRSEQKKGQLKLDKMDIINETGDLFFSLICLTNFLEIDLEEALLNTLKKYSSRQTYEK